MKRAAGACAALTLSKAPWSSLMLPVLDRSGAAELLGFPFFSLEHHYSPAGVQVLGHQICSDRLQLSPASIHLANRERCSPNFFPFLSVRSG